MPSLDLRKHRKSYLKLTLPDEEETKLSVMQPTKELFGKMTDMSANIGTMTGSDYTALDEVYEVCAELISRNKEGVYMTRAQLEELLDFEDIVVLLRTYSEFVASIMSEKN